MRHGVPDLRSCLEHSRRIIAGTWHSNVKHGEPLNGRHDFRHYAVSTIRPSVKYVTDLEGADIFNGAMQDLKRSRITEGLITVSSRRMPHGCLVMATEDGTDRNYPITSALRARVNLAISCDDAGVRASSRYGAVTLHIPKPTPPLPLFSTKKRSGNSCTSNCDRNT